MIKQVGYKADQNLVNDFIHKDDVFQENTGFFLIDSNNQIHCISAYLCDILEIDNYNTFLSGEVIKRLILPGDLVYINYQFLSVIKDFRNKVKIELKFQTYYGLKTVIVSKIKPLSDSLLFVTVELKED